MPGDLKGVPRRGEARRCDPPQRPRRCDSPPQALDAPAQSSKLYGERDRRRQLRWRQLRGQPEAPAAGQQRSTPRRAHARLVQPTRGARRAHRIYGSPHPHPARGRHATRSSARRAVRGPSAIRTRSEDGARGSTSAHVYHTPRFDRLLSINEYAILGYIALDARRRTGVRRVWLCDAALSTLNSISVRSPI